MHESRVISAVLRTSDVDVLFRENVSDFFQDHGDTWQWIKEYYNKYREMPTVELVYEGTGFNAIEANGAVEHYLDGLRAFYLKNKADHIATVGQGLLQGNPAEEVIDMWVQKLQDLKKYSVTATESNIMDLDAAEQHYAAVRQRVADMGGVPGITTGVKTIDAAYPTGLVGGDLVVVVGYTGRKKSFFTTLMACNAYDKGYKPMILSLEMSKEKVRDRVFTILGSGLFSNTALSLGDVTEDSFAEFRKNYNNKQDFVVVTGDGRMHVSPSAIQSKIDQHKPDIVILDYAQIMGDNAGSDDMTRKMLNLANECKELAVANDIPVVLISSATADGKVGQDPPTVEQVAWSKQLAFNADLCFAVHGIDETDYIKIVCRKNRNGPMFSCLLDWDVDRGVWEESYIDV